MELSTCPGLEGHGTKTFMPRRHACHLWWFLGIGSLGILCETTWIHFINCRDSLGIKTMSMPPSCNVVFKLLIFKYERHIGGWFRVWGLGFENLVGWDSHINCGNKMFSFYGRPNLSGNGCHKLYCLWVCWIIWRLFWR